MEFSQGLMHVVHVRLDTSEHAPIASSVGTDSLTICCRPSGLSPEDMLVLATGLVSTKPSASASLNPARTCQCQVSQKKPADMRRMISREARGGKEGGGGSLHLASPQFFAYASATDLSSAGLVRT